MVVEQSCSDAAGARATRYDFLSLFNTVLSNVSTKPRVDSLLPFMSRAAERGLTGGEVPLSCWELPSLS